MSFLTSGNYIEIFLVGFLVPFVLLVVYWKVGNFFRVFAKRQSLKNNKFVRK